MGDMIFDKSQSFLHSKQKIFQVEVQVMNYQNLPTTTPNYTMTPTTTPTTIAQIMAPQSPPLDNQAPVASSSSKSTKGKGGEGSFQCETCGRAFLFKNNLKAHLRTHTRDKKYECPLCQKSFIYKESLKNHMLLHSNELPYHCDICGKKFRDRSNRRKHVKNVHKVVEGAGTFIDPVSGEITGSGRRRRGRTQGQSQGQQLEGVSASSGAPINKRGRKRKDAANLTPATASSASRTPPLVDIDTASQSEYILPGSIHSEFPSKSIEHLQTTPSPPSSHLIYTSVQQGLSHFSGLSSSVTCDLPTISYRRTEGQMSGDDDGSLQMQSQYPSSGSTLASIPIVPQYSNYSQIQTNLPNYATAVNVTQPPAYPHPNFIPGSGNGYQYPDDNKAAVHSQSQYSYYQTESFPQQHHHHLSQSGSGWGFGHQQTLPSTSTHYLTQQQQPITNIKVDENETIGYSQIPQQQQHHNQPISEEDNQTQEEQQHQEGSNSLFRDLSQFDYGY